MVSKENIKYYYPLSSLQEGMLFHYLMDPSTTANVYQFSYRINGKLDLDAFEKSWNLITERHDVLRTNIVHKKVKKPIQVVLLKRKIPFEVKDIRYLNRSEQETYLQHIKQQDKEKGFDLSKDSLSRVLVMQVSDTSFEILWTYHHIILDGWCMGILMSEMMYLYDSLLKGVTPHLPEVKGYGEYITYLSKISNTEKEQFWKNYLNEYEPEVLIPKMDVEPSNAYRFAFFEEKVRKGQVSALRKLAEENNVTFNTVIQILWAMVLARFAGKNDIVFGYTVSGRPPEIEGVEQMVGLFINTIPVRIRFSADDSFSSMIKRVHQEAIKAQRFHHSSLADIQSSIHSKHHLFDHIVLFENFPLNEKVKEESAGILQIEEVHNAVRTNYDFNLIFLPGETLTLRIEYNAHVYSVQSVERVVRLFLKGVENVLSYTNQTIVNFSLITEQERQFLLNLNETMHTYPNNVSIISLFEQQADATPDNVALVFQQEKITYRGLNNQANQLAHYLQSKEVQPNDVVGIEVGRSTEMIVSILGILKVGAAYLPIDPTFPEERKLWMKTDSAVKLVLEEADVNEAKPFPQDNLHIDVSPNAVAYIMYTSGSTGTPKGIKIPHYAVNRLVKNTNYIDVNERDNILQLSNYAFDGSTFDIYASLLNGATLTILESDTAKDNQKLSELIEEQHITLFFCTTALFNTLIDLNIESLKSVRKILFGGERVSAPHVKKALQTLGKEVLVHVYGPTESTTFATYYPINDVAPNATNIPIGQPISNTQVYILDQYQRLCGIDMPGELCIAGDGLAIEYLNNPELTDEKFVQYEGKRIYRTGDLVRLLSTGQIEFLDRIDSQVKVRGFRIELGEIENKLLEVAEIKESYVMVATDNQNFKYLAAYYVSDNSISEEEIQKTLSKTLPDYMLPTAYVHMEQFPLNSSGKVNKGALPEPHIGQNSGTGYVPATNETEQTLVEIWQEVLSVEKVSIQDNFFKLGGHSLKAIQIASAIKKRLDIMIELKHIFKYPTIAEFANTLQGNAANEDEVNIIKAPDKSYYSLSSAQKRQFFLYQLDPESLVYNMPIVLEVEGDLDVNKLEIIINQIVSRHESLRTKFVWIDNEVYQQIEDGIHIPVIQMELGKKSVEEAVGALIAPFPLETGPVLRTGLIKLNEKKHILVIDMHHIISDGISMNVLTNEFIQLFQGQQLDPLTLQYKDYSEWQNNAMQKGRLEKQKDYWLSTLDGELPVLQLPEDFSRPANQRFEGEDYVFELNAQQTNHIKALAEKEGATLFVTLFAMYALLLSKYSGQHDIIVGTPISGRPQRELQKIIGMFVNTLALRVQPKGKQTFLTYLNDVKDRCFDAFQHQEFQFEELIEHLNLPRDPSRNPVFDTLFTLHHADNLVQASIDGLQFNAHGSDQKVAKFDLSFIAQEGTDEISIGITYSTHLFKKETIQKMADAFTKMAAVIIAQPQIALADISLLSDHEKQSILKRNEVKSTFPKEKNIISFFEDSVQKYPTRTAITFEDTSISYQELNERVNQMAHHIMCLRSIQKDDLMGVLANRSENMIVAVLAVLKTGAAYVPIDPEYPEDRIRHMVTDSGIGVLLKDESVKNTLDYFSGDIITIQDPAIHTQPKTNLGVNIAPNSLAYIIYTSGSTGLPKGTMVEHRNVVSLLKPEKALFDFNENDVWTLFHSFCFDFSVWEIFGALLFGGKLVVMPKETAQNPEIFAKLLSDQKVTVLNQIPSLFLNNAQYILNANTSIALRYVIFGGEALKPSSLQQWMKRFPEITMVNMYGITETTVHVTFKKITLDDAGKGLSNIGKPITTLKCLILDEYQQLVPDGVPGEICVGGYGVTRGYLHKPELTAQRFIDHPYAPEEILYRSGDSGRTLPNGDIEYLGRIDQQVKIRGHRIEIGEVENVIQSLDEVEDTVVLARNDLNNEKVLVAYVKSGSLSDISYLRNHLKSKLPQYSIPSYFSILAEFPISPTGKIDKRALPSIAELMGSSTQEMITPTSALEKEVSKAWSTILKVESISIDANFFEVGGHSLKATQLSNYISQHLHLTISIKDIFTHPTIKEQAELLETRRKLDGITIPKAPPSNYYSLSYAQQRVWVACQFEGASAAFNMPAAFQIKGDLDVTKFQHILQQIVQRHEVLRTSFEVIDGAPVQKIHEHTDFKLEISDVSHQSNALEEAKKISDADAAKPFDLTDACLMRAHLIQTGENQHVFALNMHHIISDGWSMQVLMSEVLTLYSDASLGDLRIQYKDFAQWQNSVLQEEKELEQYWKKNLRGIQPLTVSHRDRPKKKTYGGAYFDFKIEGDNLEAFKQKRKQWKVSSFAVIQAAYQVLLYRLSSQADFVIGTPDAGRNHPELEQQIGFYVNMVPLRSSVENSDTFKQLLIKVADHTVEALDKSLYPFDKIVEDLGIKTQGSRMPIFDYGITWQNMVDMTNETKLSDDDISVESFKQDYEFAKYDLWLFGAETESAILLNFEYNTDIFNQDEVIDFAEYMQKIMSEVVHDEHVLLTDIQLAHTADTPNDEDTSFNFEF